MERLVVVLVVCGLWSAWKAVALQSWPVLSSWRYLLDHLGLGPLVYIVLCYVWVAWASWVAAGRYRSEVSWRSIGIGLLTATPFVAFYGFLRGVDVVLTLLTLATFSLFGGVVEEVLYRGLLLDELVERLGVWRAVVAQSVVFGLSHPWSMGAVMAGIVFGVVAAFLRLRAGMGSNIAFHWLINGVTHV